MTKDSGCVRLVVTKPALATAILLLSALPLASQNSRVDAIAQQQAEKAANVQPYEPSKAERVFLAVKEEFIDSPSGFYPLFGSVYSGGGAAFGAGYRQYYGDRAFWDIKGLWSVRNYKFAELSTSSPGHANGRLDWNASAGWRDATQAAYYGLGNSTMPDARANFTLKQAFAGGGMQVRPIPWVVAGVGVQYEQYNVEEGRGAHPSIEEGYTPLEAPALGASPAYVHSTSSMGVDWRRAAGYARRGGLYEVRYQNYLDRNDAYDFDRLEAEVVQHLPLLRENWVISVHGLMDSTLGNDDVTPFFLLPSLGGGSSLRGYPSWRFRDRHSLLLQGEFRWIPNRNGLDMAVFYDAGKVAGRRADLDFKGLKRDAGIEVRFHGPAATPLRLGLARGDEGWMLVFSGLAAF
jgi:hypothetical protein